MTSNAPIAPIAPIAPKKRVKRKELNHSYRPDDETIEIGVDEVGRGPLFGRVYVAAVVLPRTSETFQYELMKDSKRFTSEKKIRASADHIREHATAYSVEFEEADTIDRLNIRNATLKCMHRAVNNVRSQLESGATGTADMLIIVDGKDFRPVTYFNHVTETIESLNHECIVGGDDLYCSIAAASIIAKVARDDYIRELCTTYPLLHEYYNLASNKGYGAAAHMEGIVQHGITKWHRMSYRPVAVAKKKLPESFYTEVAAGSVAAGSGFVDTT